MSSVGKGVYYNSMHNPHGSIGIVRDNNYIGDHIYKVEWGLDVWNCYRVDEVEPVDPILLEDLI